MANFTYNTTPNYWAVQGVSLQTHAWNITTWGDKEGVPPTRGANVIIPFASGQSYVPKVPDSRTITLNMWVTGANADGSIPKGALRGQFETNFAALRSLCWAVRNQVQLSKMVTYPDGSLQRVVAMAEYAGGLAPSMHGTDSALFSVDFLLADPYFYGPAVPMQKLSTQSNVLVQGDDRTEAVTFAVSGPRTNVRIQNTTPAGQPWFQYNAAIATGQTVLFTVPTFTATYQSNTGLSAGSGRVSHSGIDPYWFYLAPGNNTISITSSSGNGAVSMSWQPRFF